MSHTMSNCRTCAHIHDKSNGWCAMFVTNPTTTCHRHTVQVERWQKWANDYKSTHPNLHTVDNGSIVSHPTKEMTDEKD